MSKEKHTPTKIVYICTGEKCKKRGSKEIAKSLRDFTKHHRLGDLGVIRTHCTDNCKHGPVVCLQPGSEWHFHVDEHKAIALVKKLDEKDKVIIDGSSIS
ncbi:MAG TPA: (2Fe-2S) ferredoxin domain-containing protein [Chryseosolibacter sp.]